MTDNKKIAKIAREYGADVPFLRPKKFSRDSSSTLDVVQHTIHYLQKVENYTPDIITILLPTSPFRSPDLIDKSIKLLKKTNATSVVSVFKSKEHAFKAFLPKGGFLKPFKSNYRKYYRRQLLPDFYHTTGAAYTFWFDTLKKLICEVRTILWNGPLGAFEYKPFDNGTNQVAKLIKKYTKNYQD